MSADNSSGKDAMPSRRQFIRRSARGISLFGLGGALGLIPGRAKAAGASSSLGRSLGKEYSYDISRLSKTDPALIHYQQSTSFTTGLKEVRRAAIGPDDRVYVAGDRSIVVFAPSGARLREIHLAGQPRCVFAAEDGIVYAGFKDHLEVFDANGTELARWESLGQRAVLTSIAVSDDNVFIADAGNRLVLRFDKSGKLLNSIGKKNPAKNAPGFIVPSPYFDIAVGPEGLLWAANPGRHRIEAYTFDGDFELSWGEVSFGIDGFCGCCNPVNFALMSGGRFVTAEKGLTRVKVYSPKGAFESVVAGAEQFPKHFGNPLASPVGIDVAVDSQDRVLIADPMSNELRVFTQIKAS